MSPDGSAKSLLDKGSCLPVGQSSEKGGDKRGELLSSHDWERVGRELGLSHRELEVVQHIFEGKKLLAIAQEMGLGLGTVKTYSQRIHQKLQVSDQLELALVVFATHSNGGNSSK